MSRMSDKPPICPYCNSFFDDKRAKQEALYRIAYLARIVSGQATMEHVNGGGFWTVTQSTMGSLRAQLECLDRHSGQLVR